MKCWRPGLTAQAAALVHDQGAKAEIKLAQALQKARYVDGISAANSDLVRKVLAEFGVDRALDEGKGPARKISAEAAKIASPDRRAGCPQPC